MVRYPFERQSKQLTTSKHDGDDMSSSSSNLEAGLGGCGVQKKHDVLSESYRDLDKSVRSMAHTQSKVIRSGSGVVYLVLTVAAITMSLATYFLLTHTNAQEFESEFHSYAREVSEIAEKQAENTFQQLQTLATTITSHGTKRIHGEGGGFPNVTVPYFDIRVQEIVESSGIEMVMFVPIVEQDRQEGWESFINNQIANHVNFHDTHGEEMMHQSNMTETMFQKIVPCHSCENVHTTREGFMDEEQFMETILDDLGYQSVGLKAPVAQFGPASTHDFQSLLLQDLFAHPIFKKEFVTSLEYDVPVLSEVIDLDFLLAHVGGNDQGDLHEGMMTKGMTTTHGITHQMKAKTEKLRSFSLNPVKESFEEGAKTVGFVVGIVPWQTLFENILSSDRHDASNHDATIRTLNGLVAIVTSDCGITFTHVLNGGRPDSQMLGDRHELHDHFAHMSHHSTKLFWKEHPKGISRHCHFDLGVYPSEEFYSSYQSSDAFVYAAVVASLFAFTAILFSFFDRLVVRRQNKVVDQAQALVLEGARKAARNERELNDFIAHEVRNPLAAAMSACSFVQSAVSSEETNPLVSTKDKQQSVEEDLQIIDHSLHFINDLLRNMLDMNRASSNEMTIENKPTHLMDDVFRPIANMLHVRGSAFHVELDCPPEVDEESSLVVMTDSLRLKQILLNLSRNAVKFVERGFIRLRCHIDKEDGNNIILSVEDSGPGIPEGKRDKLFGKFQETLDTMSQGTGIGLNLCKKLADLMGANLYIDESYDSGVPGCPGTRIVFDMRKRPIRIDDAMLMQLTNNHSVLSSDGDQSLKDSTCHTNKLLGNSATSSTSSASFEMIEDSSSTDEEQQEEKLPTELPKGLNVLFTDDDMVLRKLFNRSLRNLAPDWNIKEAANGETAIQMVEDRMKETNTEDTPFDLIFMDQYMASVQKQLLGTETVRALRSMGVTSLICGLSANDVESAFREGGADAFMFKPFPCKPVELKAELLRIIHLRPP